MNDKIQRTHLDRRAVVYLRQSTVLQVRVHRESTLRQYDLRGRALALGWAPETVDTIDEDLGHSGSSAEGRSGFQRLAHDVAHGRVGAIFALEVSRLARSSSDWHRLLDLCRLADVVIVDEQSTYAPRQYDDQLLLGLKGTMAEAELVWLRLRLQGGLLNKARRGELRVHPATGYRWDASTQRLRFDPDEAVRNAIALLFERFRVEGSAQGVCRYFARNGLRVPATGPESAETRWVPPRPAYVATLLHNPVYGGAYVFGRRHVRTALVAGQIRPNHVTYVPQKEWAVFLPGHHPGYIPWEEFMANQEKLHQNRSNHRTPEQRGAAREGAALLQGLVLCGRCGQRMRPEYPRRADGPRYVCRSPKEQLGVPEDCWSLAGRAVDEAVAGLFLEAASPPGIALGLAVAQQAEKQAGEVDRQWRLRVDRATYEAKLAERRYKAIDPDNRVVARTLEREWEEKLRALEDAEAEHRAVRNAEKVELSDADRARILDLASDLPRVWAAETTTQAQRKTLLRTLVREVTLSPVDLPVRATRIQVLWETGSVSDFVVERPRGGGWNATDDEIVASIRQRVLRGEGDEAIAAALNATSRGTGTGRAWTAEAVYALRMKRRIHMPNWTPSNVRRPDRRADGRWSVNGVMRRFAVSRATVATWIANGWLVPTEGGGKGITLWFDDDAIARMVERAHPEADNPSPQRG